MNGSHPTATQRYANVGDDIDPADLHIMKLVALGRTNIAIAHQVGASPRAIGQRVRGVQRDLNSATKIAAVVRLVRAGLI